MLETMRSKAWTAGSGFLILKEFSCRTCGRRSEYLLTPDEVYGESVYCPFCGGAELETAVGGEGQDFYW